MQYLYQLKKYDKNMMNSKLRWHQFFPSRCHVTVWILEELHQDLQLIAT